MSRFAPTISLEEFKEHCESKFKFTSDRFDPEFDPYEDLKYTKSGELTKIGKDLAKINFDMENYTFGNATADNDDAFGKYPVGYEVLPSGLPVLFVNAGGDWECPICFCIYFDGKSLRGYIPTDGNVFNKKEKCAYGSENVDLGDPDLIRADVMNRIQIKN